MRKITLRSILLLILLIFLLFLYLEDIFPLAKFSEVSSQDVNVKNPENYKKVKLIYNIKTEYNNNSLITLKDLKENIEDNIILLKQNPAFFEGKYKNGYIYIVDKIPCIPVFSVKQNTGGIFNFLRKIKYYLIYPVNKDYAFYERFKILNKNLVFEQFNPIVDKCFIGSSESYIKIKKVSDNLILYPDLKNQFKLIKNFVYVPNSFDSKGFNEKKDIILQNLGRSYVSFHYQPNFDFYIKTIDGKNLFIGDRVNLKEHPLIYVKKPEGNYIIAVYKNGKIIKYYNTSFILEPENIGYYFFIVYRYETKISGGFYTSVEPVIITNPIFIQ